jgi:hypothetical protein
MAPARPDGFSYEIHLNQEGLNTIGLPCDPVIVEAGSRLILELINHGTPLHLTLSSSNIAMFSEFSHQNLYVEDRATVTIPIRPESYRGEFTLDVITGYGARKVSFRVAVREAAPETIPVPEEAASVCSRFMVPAPYAMVAIVLSLILYLAWFFILRTDLFNILAFLVLLGGALSLWLSPR